MKLFLPFNAPLPLVRNDKTISLVPITQQKGSKGVFPGLDSKTFKLDDFKAWLPKNKETDAANTLANFIIDSFNELSCLVWRETVANNDIEIDSKTKPEDRPTVTVSDEVYKTMSDNFIANLTSLLGGERTKERDSKFFFGEFKRLSEMFRDEKDAIKKAEFKRLAIEAKKTADTLQKAEDDKINADFEAMMK